MRSLPIACAVSLPLLVCLFPANAPAADDAAGSRALQLARERLDRSVTLELHNQPVETAVRRLAEGAHCTISIAPAALKRDSDPPRRVRLAVYDVPASSALELIVVQAEWAEGVVVVADAAGDGVRLAPRARLRPVRAEYDVADLDRAQKLPRDAGEELTQTAAMLIQETVAPDTWQDYGGQFGQIEQDPERKRLRVTTTPDLHEQIANLLAELVADADENAIEQPDEPAHRRARGLLEQSVSLPMKGQTVREALAQWHRETDLPLVVHWDEMQSAGITPNIPLDVRAPRGASVPAREAMTAILRTTAAAVEGSRLGFNIDGDGVVHVSTAKETADIVTRMYNLRPVLRAWSKAPGFRRDRKTVEEYMEQVVRLLTETIDPDTWRDAGGSVGAVKVWGAAMIVTHTRDTHRRFAGLLRQLAGEDVGSPVEVKWGHDGPRGEVTPTLVTRIYPLNEIPPNMRGRGGETWDEEAANCGQFLVKRIAPETWRDNGGSVGHAMPCGPFLVVTQTPENQKRVARVLGRAD